MHLLPVTEELKQRLDSCSARCGVYTMDLIEKILSRAMDAVDSGTSISVNEISTTNPVLVARLRVIERQRLHKRQLQALDVEIRSVTESETLKRLYRARHDINSRLEELEIIIKLIG